MWTIRFTYFDSDLWSIFFVLIWSTFFVLVYFISWRIDSRKTVYVYIYVCMYISIMLSSTKKFISKFIQINVISWRCGLNEIKVRDPWFESYYIYIYKKVLLKFRIVLGGERLEHVNSWYRCEGFTTGPTSFFLKSVLLGCAY